MWRPRAGWLKEATGTRSRLKGAPVRWRSLRAAALLAQGWLSLGLIGPTALAQQNAPTVIYATGFEVAEGYTGALDNAPLRGQMGWDGEGSGGNGLVDDFFPGWGQQAFVGFLAPAYKDDFLNIWRPVGYTPPGPDQPLVKFSVLMQVVDSTNGEYDDFRWSVYNTAGQRLFSLDFDNSRAEVLYLLDDNSGFRSTGFAFRNDVVYELVLWMNFWRNTWMALLNGQVVVDSQPITTINARLDLSDVDAVWALRRHGWPGDNYLLFDDYILTAHRLTSIPPVLEIVGRHPTGEFELYLHGERGLRYAIDATSDLVNWDTLYLDILPTGFLDFVDTTAPDYAVSVYRARQVP